MEQDFPNAFKDIPIDKALFGIDTHVFFVKEWPKLSGKIIKIGRTSQINKVKEFFKNHKK